MSENRSKETEMGLDENVAGALCYVLTWLTGIIFLLIEKKNRFVRFHAMQSIVTFLPLTILGWLLRMMTTPFYGWGFSLFWLISNIIWLGVFVLWLVSMYKAYRGETYKLPIAGNIAENQLK